MQLWWWKKFAWLPPGGYLTLCIANLQLCELFEQVCTAAESGMSDPADCPRLAEKADARSKIWKYFTHIADHKGKPTDTTKPTYKWCFKSVMTKGANTFVSLCSVTVTVKPHPLCLQAVRKQREAAYTLPRGRTKFIKYRYLYKTWKAIVFNGWVLRHLSSI